MLVHWCFFFSFSTYSFLSIWNRYQKNWAICTSSYAVCTSEILNITVRLVRRVSYIIKIRLYMTTNISNCLASLSFLIYCARDEYGNYYIIYLYRYAMRSAVYRSAGTSYTVLNQLHSADVKWYFSSKSKLVYWNHKWNWFSSTVYDVRSFARRVQSYRLL